MILRGRWSLYIEDKPSPHKIHRAEVLYYGLHELLKKLEGRKSKTPPELDLLRRPCKRGN